MPHSRGAPLPPHAYAPWPPVHAKPQQALWADSPAPGESVWGSSKLAPIPSSNLPPPRSPAWPPRYANAPYSQPQRPPPASAPVAPLSTPNTVLSHILLISATGNLAAVVAQFMANSGAQLMPFNTHAFLAVFRTSKHAQATLAKVSPDVAPLIRFFYPPVPPNASNINTGTTNVNLYRQS